MLRRLLRLGVLRGIVGMALLSGVRRARRGFVRVMLCHGHMKDGCSGYRRQESQPDANDQQSLSQSKDVSQQATVRQRTTRSLVLSDAFCLLEILPIDQLTGEPINDHH